MNISKTTINMAARRDIALTINKLDQVSDTKCLEISIMIDGEAADEYDAAYRITERGLVWYGSCLTRSTEEWPAWIANEADLRALLPAIRDELYNPSKY